VFETATGIQWIREKTPERTDWIRPLAPPGNQTIVYDPQKAIAKFWHLSYFGDLAAWQKILGDKN
jgi:hypothetical protein